MCNIFGDSFIDGEILVSGSKIKVNVTLNAEHWLHAQTLCMLKKVTCGDIGYH